jgi:hypothetical protein
MEGRAQALLNTCKLKKITPQMDGEDRVAVRAADKGLFVVGGVGGAVVGGMVGAAAVVVEAMIGKAADTRLIGFLVLPAISRKRYG